MNSKSAVEEMTDKEKLEWFVAKHMTVAVDFDGVLHPYTAGWVGSVPADEIPMAGASVFLQSLKDEGFNITIFSTRADHEEGLSGIIMWLTQYNLMRFVDKVTHEKS